MKSKRNGNWYIGSLLTITLLASPALGQDSISNTPCLPGDAVSPWDTTEQRNDYVVDLAPLTTSWGTTFGIAPILKSSKTNSGFFGSLTSAHGISRNQLTGQPLDGTYALWSAPGFGINDLQNDPGTPIDMTGHFGNQFAVGFAEFSTTDPGANYNGVVSGLVRYEITDPSRLYVSRIMAAVNSCDNASNVSQFGMGSVDASGNLHFRADCFGCTAGGGASCTPVLNNLLNNNIFRIDISARNSSALNVISNDFVAGGLFDLGSTEWLVRNDATNYNTPGTVPEAVMGSAFFIGTNWSSQYAYGPSFGSITTTLGHLAAPNVDQRGNISYTSKNCAFLSSTHGIAGEIGNDGSNSTSMNVWGLGATGAVTGSIALTLPATITDPVVDPVHGTNATNLPGLNEFDHYHSQVWARGGNGQVALGVDQDGNLLAAAEVDHPSYGGYAGPVNYIGVARVNCTTGNVEWSMAGYIDGSITEFGTGKPILDGPGGNVIGRMVTLDNVTGGVPVGPSVSAPMIDSVGNVWFLSAVELFDPVGGNTFNNAMLRAVYNPAIFGYELELIWKLGDVFHGQNSNLDYLISFMSIADNDSVDSGTAWSQNISETAHLNQNPAGLSPADPATLGGLVMAVEIVYDADQDQDFQQPCDGTAGNQDQDYNVLLYLGAEVSTQLCTTHSDCDDDDCCTHDECVASACQNTSLCTGKYGDVDNNCDVNLNDLLAMLDGLASVCIAQGWSADVCANLDIDPCAGNDDINLQDLLALLDALAGTPAVVCP